MNKLLAKKIIGVTGKIGAGKTSFVKELILQIPRDLERIAIGSILKERLVASGLPTTRDNLTSLAGSLREQFGPTVIVDIVREKIQQSRCHFIVIDGVRGLRMKDLMQEYEGSILVAVVADLDVRYKRITSRPEKPDEMSMTKDEFLELDEKEYSKELDILETMADVRVENSSSYENLALQVKAFTDRLDMFNRQKI